MTCISHRPGRPYEGRPSQSKRTLADALNLLHGMRHEQNRHVTALDKVLNTGLALLLEEHVADGKHLIDDQDIGLLASLIKHSLRLISESDAMLKIMVVASTSTARGCSL